MQTIPSGKFQSYYKLLKHKIWERDNYTCKYCGLYMKDLYDRWKRGEIKRKEAKLTVDHIIPKRPDEPHRDSSEENLVTACWDCNQRKGGFKALEDKAFSA